MEKVFGYIRVSTIGQAKEGFSLEQQKDEIAEYCQTNNFELVRTYEDAGASGAKADEEELTVDRPGLQDMLADLGDSGVKYIIVLTTSRLWRSDIVKVLIQRELKRHNVDIRAVDRPGYSIYNDSDPSAFLINGMLELLDQYERLEIALKLKRGRNKKASKGGYSGGGAAIGYRSNRGSKVLTIDPQKIATVKRVFAIRDTHPDLSLQKIADRLNWEGHTTAQGKPFGKVQVKRILDRKPLYSGEYQYSGITATGQHEAII